MKHCVVYFCHLVPALLPVTVNSEMQFCLGNKCCCSWARSDLQAWMQAQQSGEGLSASVELDEPEIVLETIESVKQQQSEVVDQLETVQQQLETELQIS